MSGSSPLRAFTKTHHENRRTGPDLPNQRAHAALLRKSETHHPTTQCQWLHIYSEQDAEIVRKVMLLNRTGLPLKDIALMRDCLRDEPQNFCADLRGKLTARQADIDRQIAWLQASKRLLGELLAR